MISYQHSKVLSDRKLKYEIYLDEICQSLQLGKKRKEKMTSAYNSVSTLLENSDFFGTKDLLIYAYGSEGLGTNTKPYKREEFDLDWVSVISASKSNLTPAVLLDKLFLTLHNDLRYRNKIKRMRYCVRINYEGDFHMDIMPCLRASQFNERLFAPDSKIGSFVGRFPKGYISWFKGLFISDTSTLSLSEYYKLKMEMRAQTEDLPASVPYELSQPIQRAVQLIKRARDVYFENNPDVATSSVILTTLVGRFYEKEVSITEAITNINTRISNSLKTHRYPFILEIYNPADDNLPLSQREKLNNKWNEGEKGKQRYLAFIEFIKWFSIQWNRFLNDAIDSEEVLKELFGEHPLKSAIESRGELINTLNFKGLLGVNTGTNSLSSDPSANSYVKSPTNTNHGEIF